jgi:putative spermidine/putrescine transport system substrate-binding protein
LILIPVLLLAGSLVTAQTTRVRMTMFIWLGSNQGVVPREVVADYLRTRPNVEIEFLESNNTITYPRMVAARLTTPNQPLVHFGFFNVSSINKGDVDDMWESLNPDRIPNMRNVLPAYRRPEEKGVGYQISTMGLIYNKERVSVPPTSWTDLWHPRFRGRVVQFDNNWESLVVAAKLNGGSEENIDPGFRLWSENAQQFRALVDSNDALKNLLVSGDAWIAPWFSSLANVWIEEGAPLAYVNPVEGPVAFPIYLTIVKGVNAQQRQVAEEIINLLLAPGPAARYGELTYAIPTVANAAVSERVRNDPNLNPRIAEQAIVIDYAKVAEMNDVWRDRWEREVKARMR